MELNEGSTGWFTARLMAPRLDDDGLPVLAGGAPILDPVPGSTITSLKLTWYEQSTEAIVNDRDHQECVPFGGAAGVSVDEDGRLTWRIASDDLEIQVDSAGSEVHVALFEIAIDDTLLTHEAEITVMNLGQLPAPPTP